MKKYRETFIFILIVILVGGGLHVLRAENTILDNRDGVEKIWQDSSEMTLTQLEQIGRLAHDYLNGYLSGSKWGTVLSEEMLKIRMELLAQRFQMIRKQSYSQFSAENSMSFLMLQFEKGFKLFKSGIENNDLDILHRAHSVFQGIDYEFFNHGPGDELLVRVS